MATEESTQIEDLFLEAARALSGARSSHMFEDLLRATVKLVGADIGLIGRYIDIDGVPYIRSLGWLVKGRLLPNEDYLLAGTPCETVVGKTFRAYADRVGELFPTTDAYAYGIHGYAAYPLEDANGDILGIISVMTYKPLENQRLCESVLRIFAERVSHEIMRADADQKLRESEERYRAIFDATIDGFVLLDKHGIVVDANAAIHRIDGFSREEIIGKLPPTFRADQSKSRLQNFLQRILEREQLDVQLDILCKSGNYRTVDTTSIRILYQGEPHIFIIVRDVHDQHKVAQAMMESEARYRAMFDSSLDGLVLLNADGVVVDVNPAILDIDGFSRDELIGDFPPGFREGEKVAKHRAYVSSVLGGKHIRHQAKLPRKNGTHYFAEMSATALDYQDQPHVLAVVRDVTDKVFKERALNRSQARLEATVTSALDAIISVNENGEILDFNPAAEETFGYTANKAIGREMAEIIIPERLRGAHRAGMKRFLGSGQAHMIGRRVEVTAQRSDGEEFPAELSISVSEDGSGKIFTGYLRDLTEVKKVANDRAMLEAQLRQAQKMEAIGHLTGGVAHDFNNILTGVLGYVEMARDQLDPETDHKLTKYLSRAQRAGEKARDLIAQMLTFSRGDTGKPRPLSLVPIVEDSISLLESTVPSSITITTHLPENLPMVVLDPVHVEQILVNLCINARDAMDGKGKLDVSLKKMAGEGIVCTSCSSNLTGDYVELAVRDTGPGIEQALVSRIFEPFFSTKETGKGSGMGLATVHGIIHEHGGHIAVDTEIGSGTTMRILFPASNASEDPAVSRTLRWAGQANKELLSGSILVVDDNQQVAEFLQELLIDWGLDVNVFHTGDAALEHFLSSPDAYSVVITDQTMPGVTGMQLAESLLREKPNLPIILYTGYSDVVTPAKVKQLGIRALVKKPLDIPEFRKTLESILSP